MAWAAKAWSTALRPQPPTPRALPNDDAPLRDQCGKPVGIDEKLTAPYKRPMPSSFAAGWPGQTRGPESDFRTSQALAVQARHPLSRAGGEKGRTKRQSWRRPRLGSIRANTGLSQMLGSHGLCRATHERFQRRLCRHGPALCLRLPGMQDWRVAHPVALMLSKIRIRGGSVGPITSGLARSQSLPFSRPLDWAIMAL